MSKNILVIGGVALGPKAACRCKRLLPNANVTIIDENELISYGGCGMPFYLSGEISNLDDLRATPYHRIRDASYFDEIKDVKVRTQTRALNIDRAAKTVLVENVISKQQETLSYDELVIATGASAHIPNIEGVNLKNVYAVTRLEAVRDIRKDCEQGKIQQAVIIGGGFIGLECAVALAEMWGIEVSVVEMASSILPSVLSENMASMAEHDCKNNDVNIFTNEKLLRIEGEDGKVCRVVTDKRSLDAQVVILATGFKPNSQLAKDAGLRVADFGGIIVNEYMQTSDSHIYAGGDCAGVTNLITNSVGFIPLGSMANRQGRVIGSNLAGQKVRFDGYVGTWGVKLFDLTVCGTGLSVNQAKAHGFDALGIHVEQLDRAHFYPEKHMMSLELVVERHSRRVLGIQGVCEAGDALKARIDAVAVALQFSKPTVDDISNLEITYTPPLASAMDIVNTVANVADNALAGRFDPINAQDFAKLWHNRHENDTFFIDVRPAGAAKAITEKDAAWHAIPLEEIEARLSEIPKNRPLALICNTGLRAYDAILILKKHGYENISNALGGMQATNKQGFLP